MRILQDESKPVPGEELLPAMTTAERLVLNGKKRNCPYMTVQACNHDKRLGVNWQTTITVMVKRTHR